MTHPDPLAAYEAALPPTTEPEPKFLRERAVADRYSISAPLLRKWRARKTGPPYVRAGGIVLYPVAELDSWLAARLTKTA